MPCHRKRRQFKQTDAFTRGMVIGLKRAGNVAIYRNVGATRVTSARVDRRILRQTVAAPQATCTAILQHVQDTLDLSISTRTISRRLVANGLHSYRPLRRLPLTPPNRRQRLEWCRARSTWMTEWHRVVFSDESRFCLSSDSRRVRVWRRRGERSNPAAIVERPTVRQRGIMVWGAIAYDSRSPLLCIQGTMTAQRYVDDVLRPVTFPYLQGVPNALYQQDNARPHTACISQQALQDVQMLPWPPYSPDLSPIEHVWDIIGRRLHALPQPRSEDELWQMVEREWRAIPQDAIRTLIDSLPRRVAACIAVRDISDNLIKTLWLDKLPTFIKNILIVSEEDISKLAIMADKINEINSSKEIYDAEVPSSSTDRLIAKLEDLERQVSELRLDRSRSRSKNRTQSRPRSNSQRSFDPKGKYCYYHFRFGPNCLQNKCRSPCSWKESENSNRRTEAIIGADFLNNFGLIIDIKNKRLIDGITNLSIRGVIQSISDMGNISTLNSSSKVSAILTKYPNLCRPPSNFVEAKHSVKHYIPTRGQPIHSKARRLDSQRLTFAKAEFQYMLNNGIIRPSNSPWASPLHLVSKKDESLRPCGDYRRLNAITLPDRYPIPRLDDFHHILKGTRVYSKIDLCKAFYQIPIAEEDKPKTAIITPFGLFEFNVMSFGLRNATATFQRFMHEVLRNLDFAFVYLDDILVASKTEEEHYSHLETLFSRLNSYGLRINLSKSKFLVQEIDFLGYLITSHGVKPLPTKVKAILEYKKPKTVHELRIFLGMLNFYRTFLNNAAETQAILHEYLGGAKKKDRSEIKWTEEAEVQFEKCKQALANTALLAYPDTELPISLCTDASDRAVGSVLQQLDNNNWKPIAFFSKKLNPAQCNYSTYDRELLAIYLSIKFFKHLLEAREFTILTDHKPLIYAFKQKNEKASPKKLRHLQYISQFTTDIKYIKGTDNIVADALSRVDAITTIDYEEIAKEQTGDSELQNLISKNISLKFKQCPLQSGKLLWCDVSTNNIRPFIPIKFRMMACVNCQKCKVSIHTKSEIGKYQEVDERFSVVHIDLIGPLPPSNDNIYCLTCIDRYISWMEVVPLPDMKSETVARAFYENWIVRFGAPHTVISDQGKQITSQLFKDLTTLCGIKLRHSTAYHPQCKGKIERLHRTIKTAIRAHNSIKWTETLPTVLLGLNAAINKDNNHSLSQMVYGKTIRLPGEFFDDSKHHLHAEEFVQQLQKQMELLKPLNEKHHSKTKVFVHKDLKTCSHVFIRTDRVKKPLEPPYEGASQSLKEQTNSDNITAEHPTAGTGSAPDLTRTRSGRIIKKPKTNDVAMSEERKEEQRRSLQLYEFTSLDEAWHASPVESAINELSPLAIISLPDGWSPLDIPYRRPTRNIQLSGTF
ncbi:hypothetical protein LAZ67_3005199 [Cordylochernes scorpioides]|uniref:Uncharacterized protein n=1 Tax=Cordylochernes scorpioides TaxID=51811 RepID=A0ABY6KA63_9ARAC|nr:hypothetical protein LAZ67_3005199 [Cordylochernes scorpioides]